MLSIILVQINCLSYTCDHFNRNTWSGSSAMIQSYRTEVSLLWPRALWFCQNCLVGIYSNPILKFVTAFFTESFQKCENDFCWQGKKSSWDILTRRGLFCWFRPKIFPVLGEPIKARLGWVKAFVTLHEPLGHLCGSDNMATREWKGSLHCAKKAKSML